MGGRTIRYKRLRKFRDRNAKFSFIIKTLGVWCLFISLLLNITFPGTNALFTDQEKNISTFQAEAWKWDKSSLQFTNSYGGDCNGIYAFIKNVGTGDMVIPSKYYVYYNERENPVTPQGPNGELVFSTGIIPMMKSNESPVKLTFKPNKNGKYKFVAFQHPKKPGENGNSLSIDGIPVTFSEMVNVTTCTKN